MVDEPLTLTYNQITSYPNVSKVIDLNCVEGWDFTAKWTGVPVATLLDEAGVQEGGQQQLFLDLFNIVWVTKFIYICLSSVMEFKELMQIAIE